MPSARARALTFLLCAGACLGITAPAGAAITGEPGIVVGSMDGPWAVAPLGDGRVYVTERDTHEVTLVAADGAQQTVFASRTAAPDGNGYSLLGMALHPNFADNGLAYVFQRYNTGVSETPQFTRVLRLKKAAGGEQFTFDAEIFDGIPSGDPANHDGGRIAFGPDGKLYVTTGDQHQPSRPQDLGSLNGKILRLNAPGDGTDGTPPSDNPFVGDARPNARVVWSYGHRHPQGLAWDEQGRLWETEHGPSGESHAPVGAKSGRDELNLVVKGGNYGWPLVAGDQTRACTIPPAVHSGPAPAWAPGGLAFSRIDGLLYAPALNGTHLHVFEPDGDRIARHGKLLSGAPADRMRTAAADDTRLWLTTDTTPKKLLRTNLVASGGMAWDETVTAPAPPTPPACPAPPTDGGTAEPGGSETTSPTLALPASGAPLPSPGPGLPGVTTTTTPTVTPTTASVLQRLLGRTRTSLRRAGLRGLLRRGSVAARVGGLPRGRVVLRVELLRPGRRALAVATGAAGLRSRAPITVRARLTRSGGAALRRTRRARLVLRATHTPVRSTRTTRATARLTLTR